MERENQTVVTYFVLKGISDIRETRLPIFLLVLNMYLFTIMGNLVIIIIVCLDSQLHTPMYFFLCNLSVLDMLSTTVTLHKVILTFLTGDNTISLFNCMAQLYFFSFLASCELLILTAMSYDRYVAICIPLHYSKVMNRRVYILLAVVCWVFGIFEGIPLVYLSSRFSCFTGRTINHFYCDLVALMNLTCNDTSMLEIVILFDGVLITICVNFLPTFISYVIIISTILRICTSIGRRKAFYTCSSHLTIVILLYLTLFCQYERPHSKETLDSNKVISLFNLAIVPMLNPIIYSLKNKDVTAALKRRLRKTVGQ